MEKEQVTKEEIVEVLVKLLKVMKIKLRQVKTKKFNNNHWEKL